MIGTFPPFNVACSARPGAAGDTALIVAAANDAFGLCGSLGVPRSHRPFLGSTTRGLDEQIAR